IVMYLHAEGRGEVLYLTLGHCRGPYDMRPLIDVYPRTERCAWESPVYYELLRRGIRWALSRIYRKPLADTALAVSDFPCPPPPATTNLAPGGSSRRHRRAGGSPAPPARRAPARRRGG